VLLTPNSIAVDRALKAGQPIQTGQPVLWQTGQTIKTDSYTAIGGTDGTAYLDPSAVHGPDGAVQDKQLQYL